MDFKVLDGFCYSKQPISGKGVERYRKLWRFKLHPETVVDVAKKHPDIASVLDLAYYSQWVEGRRDSDNIKAGRAFSFNHEFKEPPFKHQEKAIAFVLRTPAQALFMSTGTGKTYCALVASEIRLNAGKLNKVLVVSPASVIRTGWYEDLKKYTNLKGIIAHPDKWKWVCCGKKFTNYDLAIRHVESCGSTPPEELLWNAHESVPSKIHDDNYNIFITSINQVHMHCEAFQNAGFDMMVLDESTMIKGGGGWAKSVIAVGQRCKYRLAMTGTPITQELEDIWPQMQFVDGSFESTLGKFRSRYYWQHPMHHFIRNVHDWAGEEVAKIIEPAVLRITKEECLDLPPRLSRVLEIQPSAEVLKVYKDFYKDLWARHQGEEIISFNSLTEILRLHQIINGFWTKGDDEVHVIEEIGAKARYVRDEIMPTIEGKAIIWTYYRHDARLLMQALDSYKPAMVTGQTKDVNEEVHKFKRDNECRVMIAHPKSAKYGHTWTEADTTIFYTYGYGVEDYWQARDRNYRISQTKPVTELILCYPGIEQMILSSIMKKDDFSAKVMSNLSHALRQMEI